MPALTPLSSSQMKATLSSANQYPTSLMTDHHPPINPSQSYLKNQLSQLTGLCMALAFALPATTLPVVAFAEPTVIVNNDASDDVNTGEAGLNTNTGQTTPTVDPQVAPQPATPFNENLNQTDPIHSSGNLPTPPLSNTAALQNPNSLANSMQPSDSQLSTANQELLSRNAKLQRDVNDLETQVNVLRDERSGQLFMYGAITIAVSLVFGFALGGFIFSRRERW